MGQRVLVVIPAYNEELTIGSVVTLAKKYGDVVVVNDGSRDRTSEIARSAGAVVIDHPTNKGKAQALKTGFKYALKSGYTVVVTVDADGQHNPEEIPSLVEPILDGKADIVIGSRFLNDENSEIPLYRKFGLKVLNTTGRLALNNGIKITDFQSGFRAMNSKAILELLKLNGNGYSMEGEALIYLAEKGVRIGEVPITVRYDVPNKHKKHPLKHGIELLGGIISLVGYKRPLLLFSTLSLLSFIVAGVLGYLALDPYYKGGNVYLTQAIGAGIFAIIGIQLFVAGLTLNVLVKMVRE